MGYDKLKNPVSSRCSGLLTIFLIWAPVIGSRSIVGSPGTEVIHPNKQISTFSPSHLMPPALPPPPHPPFNPKDKYPTKDDNYQTEVGAAGGGTINPCSLLRNNNLPQPVEPFNDKPILSVVHPVFDVPQGIVPNISYAVVLNVPGGSSFTLEYGTSAPQPKIRHGGGGGDGGGALELYLNPDPAPHSLTFCSKSKSSLGGRNQGSWPLLLSFAWHLKGAPPDALLLNGLPPFLYFSLRFSSLDETTASKTYEQNLTLPILQECVLLMRLDPSTPPLSLSFASFSPKDVLNCTIRVLPKPNFGVNLLIANLSVHGMRDICKGRFLSFSSGGGSKVPSKWWGGSGSGSEFPSYSPPPTFSQGRKYCGKLEDYRMEERLLKFSSGGGSGEILTIHLSLSTPIKGKESFLLELSSTSPCEGVLLTQLEGGLQYSLDKGLGGVDCSIVIHVPYGNRIIAKISLSGGDEDGESEFIAPPDNHTSIHPDFPPSPKPTNYYEEEEEEECPDMEGNRTHLHILRMRGEDLLGGGGEFLWCLDAAQRVHERAWKSSGNKVRLSFHLAHFSTFSLSYQAVGVEELVGDCAGTEGRGWVSVPPTRNTHKCALLVEKQRSWMGAEESCQLLGGHLATVENEEGGRVLERIISYSASFHPSRSYWIGANDREWEGNFQWSSGLPFQYKNWFRGWSSKPGRSGGNANAQPNDDGWSGQDCVEMRQIPHPSTQEPKKPMPNTSASRQFFHMYQQHHHHHQPSGTPHNEGGDRFYWNDRACDALNFYICEREVDGRDYESGSSISCNITLQLSPSKEEGLEVTSPGYPSLYPDNIVCTTMIETVPGYRIILSFDQFILEESPSCQYDALEIVEIHHDETSSTARNNGEDLHPPGVSKRICGDWSKRLKLLRTKTFSSRSSLSLKFESDFSHHFSGFRAKARAEKDVAGQCSEQQMKKFGSYCYLIVTFPTVNWATAKQICNSLQSNLVSILSPQEWKFITSTLPTTTSRFDKRSTLWIGGAIDRKSQLVWSDQMPFNFSAFHSSDLQTISDWKCLRIYWDDGGFAWRLADCNSQSGYICKKKSFEEAELRKVVNRTYSGTGALQSSPNFPESYPKNVDYRYHLIAPPGTQIVLRFSHLDIEDQEDCLYDYVEISDRKGNNSTRYCGTHTPKEMERMDFVSSSNEVDLHFHSDYSIVRSGFEIAWRAVDVGSCSSGKTILAGFAPSGFSSIQDAMIVSPNFPHFNLPHLDCDYTIVAPAGQRIWLSFEIFELGFGGAGTDCSDQDHVTVHLQGGDEDEEGLINPGPFILCGNLTSLSHRTSFLSSQERLRVRLHSPGGKSGRGFLGRFRAVSGPLIDSLPIPLPPNSTFPIYSFNSPGLPPPSINLTWALSAPPNYVISFSINATMSCPIDQGGRHPPPLLLLRDPYNGMNGTTWTICSKQRQRVSSHEDDEKEEFWDNERTRTNGDPPPTLSFRSTFNRLDITQIQPGSGGGGGGRWRANIITMLDENFRAKVLADGDRMLKLDGCVNNPCGNGGSCVSEHGKHICRCASPFTGPFCGLSLCDLKPCLFGECVLGESSIKCLCQLGYGGERCDRRMKPCDENPCSGHGNCLEVNKTAYKCVCHAWWEGPQCESRMMNIPYKSLSQKVLKDPFWLGCITVTVVIGVLGLIWCIKRHFPEKLEKLLNEDVDKNRGISWVSAQSGPSASFRGPAGGGVPFSVREPIPGTSQTAAAAATGSPPTARTFLGRFGIRKPSLLSLSSATSNISGAAVSPHSYENRTFSLDDLLRPSRSSMRRTPSPHRRRNYSVQMRRDPAEKQQILQALVANQSLDGDASSSKQPPTPKPTLAEIIQMSERRLRLASASSNQTDPNNTSKEGEEETSFSLPTPSTSSAAAAAASKAEKKVTFARMLDKLTAPELLSSSSSCSDLSAAEEGGGGGKVQQHQQQQLLLHSQQQYHHQQQPCKPPKKDRKGRFRRSKGHAAHSRGSRYTSETDQDCMDISSSDTTPDPIYTPKLPMRLSISPAPSSPQGPPSASLGKPGKIPKMASADSLLALFRKFSGSNSAPPSPQYSENEGGTESSAGATPLSTPGSPRASLLSIRPPALLITTASTSTSSATAGGSGGGPPLEPPNRIELPVIDPQHSSSWRNLPSSNIMLEVPLRDYCLSPIHEMPTPLATPSHSPCSTKRFSGYGGPFRLQSSMSEDDDGAAIRVVLQGGGGGGGEATKPQSQPPIPMISIQVEESEEEEDQQKRSSSLFRGGNPGESEVIPDVLIHVPPDACVESHPPEPPRSPLGSPKGTKHRPPPLIFANEILSWGGGGKGEGGSSWGMLIPSFRIEDATPVEEKTTASSSSNPPPPPIITINQNSEAESDSDTALRHHQLTRPNLCFLSPFAGVSGERVPSESNLSTSGYSSMASPCPSRCPSVSPLCPSEVEDYAQHSHTHYAHFPQRRASHTPTTSGGGVGGCCPLNKKSPLIPPLRRSSLHAPPHNGSSSGLLLYEGTQGQFTLARKFSVPEGSTGLALGLKTEVEVETDSAVEVETDGAYEPTKNITQEEEALLLLQLPKKCGFPKSKSLENGVRNRPPPLGLGPSLDSKLNRMDGGGGGAVVTLLTFPHSGPPRKDSGNLIEIPEEKERARGRSPGSSRSESPLSELGAAFMGSPLSDSDGVYDCGSSEVPTNTETSRTRRSGTSPTPNLLSLTAQPKRRKVEHRKRIRQQQQQHHHSTSGDTLTGCLPSLDNVPPEGGHGGSHFYLPPGLAKHLSLPRKLSPKRRVRAAAAAAAAADPTSSSSESLNTLRSQIRNRKGSPTPPNPTTAPAEQLSPLLSLIDGESSFMGQREDGKGGPEWSDKADGGLKGSSSSASVPLSSSRKISRLRTISHQIRFLRRLELSLMRKKECLTKINQNVLEGRRESSIFSNFEDSAEDSCRYESSESTSSSSESCSECCGGKQGERPLLSSSSTSSRSGEKK